jgi:hypothetical protein
MLTRLSLAALATIGLAGVANAETIRENPVDALPVVDYATPPAHGPHKMFITDEYGFRYDRWGNRLNAAGYVIAPPHSSPGALVIQNGASEQS